MGTLVLHLDDDLIHRAEVYSKRTGRSLDDLVAGYLRDDPLQRSVESEQASSEEGPDPSEDQAQRQYRLAGQHPGEFVVLVGDKIVCHTPDRQSAFEAYDRAFVDFPMKRPVIVDPRRRLRRRPIVRGRSLKRARTA